MKKQVQFIVWGEPKAKGRPRFSTYGGHVTAHTPKETVEYENLVRISYINDVGHEKLEGELAADIDAFFPIPKSTSKKNRLAMSEGKIMHTKKPDADNIAKSVLDSLSGIAYDDDKQVCVLKVKKYYAEQPCVMVVLKELEDHEKPE